MTNWLFNWVDAKKNKYTWMDEYGETTLSQASTKAKILNSRKPITCLPMMWNILTGEINSVLFSKELEECYRETNGTGDFIIIIIIIIMLRHQLEYPWPFPTILLYRPSLWLALQSYILYRHRVVVYSFSLVVLPLVIDVKGSTEVCLLEVTYSTLISTFSRRTSETGKCSNELIDNKKANDMVS